MPTKRILQCSDLLMANALQTNFTWGHSPKCVECNTPLSSIGMQVCHECNTKLAVILNTDYTLMVRTVPDVPKHVMRANDGTFLEATPKPTKVNRSPVYLHDSEDTKPAISPVEPTSLNPNCLTCLMPIIHMVLAMMGKVLTGFGERWITDPRNIRMPDGSLMLKKIIFPKFSQGWVCNDCKQRSKIVFSDACLTELPIEKGKIRELFYEYQPNAHTLHVTSDKASDSPRGIGDNSKVIGVYNAVTDNPMSDDDNLMRAFATTVDNRLPDLEANKLHAQSYREFTKGSPKSKVRMKATPPGHGKVYKVNPETGERTAIKG